MLRLLLLSGRSPACRLSSQECLTVSAAALRHYTHQADEPASHTSPVAAAEQPTNHAEDEFGTLTPRRMNYQLKLKLKKSKLHLKDNISIQNPNEKTGLTASNSDKYTASKLTESVSGVGPTKRRNYRSPDISITKPVASTAGQPSGPDADFFGTLCPEESRKYQSISSVEESDEADEQPHRRLSIHGRKNTPIWYGRRIEKLAKQGLLSEAVSVLEEDMLKKDRVMPSQYVFTVLIGAVARAGLTKKAFKLYNQMKKMGLQPEDATYTALFNACANCASKQEGLKRAEHLRGLLQEKNITPNLTTYKAMIKVYGVCGDLQQAFALVDELVALEYAVDEEVFKHLLIACISDSQAGFRHALLVWSRMHKRNVTPTAAHYSLLLHAIRNCGVGAIQPVNDFQDPGDIETADSMDPQEFDRSRTSVKPIRRTDINIEVIQSQVPDPPSDQSWWHWKENSILPAAIDTTHKELGSDTGTSSILNMDSNSVSLLNMKPHQIESVLNLIPLETAVERLSCLGGVPGLSQHMAWHGVTPDVKIITQMLDALPNTSDAEQDLLGMFSNHNIKPDVDFFNLVIRRRLRRWDDTGAKEVVQMIGRLQLSPNLKTFVALAMGCRNKQDARQLLVDMQALSLVPDVGLICLLMHSSKLDFAFKQWLLRTMSQLGIQPNERLLQQVERGIHYAEGKLRTQERGDSQGLPRNFGEDYRRFRMYYSRWLHQMQLDTDTTVGLSRKPQLPTA